MPSILFSHPTGSTMAKESLQALSETGYLYAYFTSLGFSEQGFFYKHCLPSYIKKKLLNRSYAIAPSLLKTHIFPEILRLAFQYFGLKEYIHHEQGRFSADACFKAHDRCVAYRILKTQDPSPTAIYGYEDSCLHTFKAAKQRGIRCIYELPIAYFERAQAILKEEALRYPNWEPTLLGNRDSDAKNQMKAEEIALADLILCPSTFVKDSLPQGIVDKTPVALTPYGCPSVLPRKAMPNFSKKLRFLFVGALGQRKGLADLLKAFQILNRKDIELITLGPLLAPLEFYKKQCPSLQWECPRSNVAILEYMQSCHVLVLPSLVEGRAIVQLEALACGLPILITSHTGGEDLVEPYQTGLLVPPRSPEKLAEAMAWFADNRQFLPAMQDRCLEKARQCSWANFRQRLLTALKEHIL